MNQSDIRMGWPAALNCIPQEPRKAHVTPPREVRGVLQTLFEAGECGVSWFSVEQYGRLITEADCRQVKQSINGAAQAARSESVRTEYLPSRSVSEPEAAPPSATDKPQGVWVKTSERKPPIGSMRLTRCCLPDLAGNEMPLTWTGAIWRCDTLGGVGSERSREWLDESPQADADGCKP